MGRNDGTSGSENGEFSSPQGIAVDILGDVYVADTFNHRIQVFQSDGSFVRKWGTSGSGVGQFSAPQGVATFSDGNSINVYVTDVANHRVQKFDSSGGLPILTVGPFGDSMEGSEAIGVAVDGSENFYVTDYNEFATHQIQKFDSSGNFLLKWGQFFNIDQPIGFNFPRGVAVEASSGNVYVADTFNNRIQVYDSNGIFLFKWGSFGSGEGQFKRPKGVAVDTSGNVYVADTGNHRIQKFSNKLVVDDAASVSEGGTVSVLDGGVTSVLANDMSADNNTLTVNTTPVNGPSNGTLTLAADGTFTYTHDGSETTIDSFTYEVADGVFTDTATVKITIIPVNDPPVALDDGANDVEFAWANWMGGIQGFPETGNGIAVDSSRNVYTTGSFDGPLDFDLDLGEVFNLTSAGDRDIFISKVDSAGNFVWAKRLGGTFSDVGFGIAVDSLGNVYTTGHFVGVADFDPGAGTVNLTGTGRNIFVSKLDSSGSFVWAKHLGAGGSFGQAVAVDSSGNVYTTGFFTGTGDFDPGAGTSNLISAGNTDIFVSKLDTAGVFVWAKNMGGSFEDQGLAIAVDGSGNVYTTGSFGGTVDFDPGAGVFNLTSAGDDDIFISKLDSNGDFVSAFRMGGTSSGRGSGIAVDSSENIYATGYFRGTADFGPFNLSSVGAGNDDIFVNKLDSDGNIAWAKQMGGLGADQGLGIAVDSLGDVYTTGIFQATADFNPGEEIFNLTSAGNGLAEIFISKLNSAGNFIWAKQMEGVEGNGLGRGITVDSLGNVYTTGNFLGIVDFDPGTGTVNLGNDVYDSIFVSKLRPTAAVGFVTDEDTAFTTGDVRANDTDPENDPLSVHEFSPDTDGTIGQVRNTGNGTFFYDPIGKFESLRAGETTTDTFGYTLLDNNNRTATATVRITITGVNDVLTANDDAISVIEGGTVTVLNGGATSLLANDAVGEDDTLSVNIDPVSGPSHGALTLAVDGTFTYIHDGAGSTTDSFVYEISDGVTTATATVTINVTRTIVFGDDGEFPGNNWSTTGDGFWVLQSGTTFNGVDALQSGAITHNQGSELSVTVTGPEVVIFWWKVSSEGADHLRFLIDDVEELSISGEVDWEMVPTLLGQGEHTLKWVYTKDGSIDVGADAGWIDGLYFERVSSIELGDGVDYSSDSWFSSGHRLWFPQNIITYDEVDALQSGPIRANEASEFSVTINGPVALGFWWKVSSESCCDILDFFVDEEAEPRRSISGDVDWHRIPVQLGSGEHTLNWIYSKDGGVDTGSDAGWIDLLELFPVSEFEEGADHINPTWITDGNALWFSQNAINFDGVDALQSGIITNNESSELSVIVEGPTTVSFYWKVSSEGNFDFLRFFVDGIEQGSGISGNMDWTLVEQSIASGEHTLQWIYSKDGSVSSGLDAGWIDLLIGGALSTNTPPMGNDDSATVAVGGTVSELAGGATSVLANDTDAEGDFLTVNTTPVDGPFSGTVTLSVDGSFTYTHDGSSTTFDGFEYEISDGVATAVAYVNIAITPVADGDGDGLLDDWENLHFGNLDQTATDDFDDDGFSNLLEFKYGTAPNDNTSFPILKIFQTGALEWPTATGVLYQIQESTDLETWVDLGDPIPGDGATMSAFVSIIGESKNFFRIVVVE